MIAQMPWHLAAHMQWTPNPADGRGPGGWRQRAGAYAWARAARAWRCRRACRTRARARRQRAASITNPNPTKRPGARWVEAAGGRVRLGDGGEGVEVSPRVSYSGEGLTPLCRGRTLRAAHDPFLQARLP